jgi:hypothetical protein
VDVDAAGRGWFADATPWDDSEFRLPGDQGEQGRLDLLTVLLHEYGHLLGHDHQEVGVMEERLAPGERLLPDPEHGPDVALPVVTIATARRPGETDRGSATVLMSLSRPSTPATPVTIVTPGRDGTVAPLGVDWPDMAVPAEPAVEPRRPRRTEPAPAEPSDDPTADARPVRVEAPQTGGRRLSPGAAERLVPGDWPSEETGVWVG